MKVAVRKGIEPGEKPVAIVPETVTGLAKKGVELCVESGAGEGSCFRDGEDEEAGVTRESSVEALLYRHRRDHHDSAPYPGGITEDSGRHDALSLVYPLTNIDLVSTLAPRKITAIAVDSIPRPRRHK